MRPGFDYVGVFTTHYCIDQGEMLFQLRGEGCRDEVGRWDPGSGKLEKGLELEENVRKEVREELGAEAEVIDRLPPHGIFREQEGVRTHWLAVPHFVKVDRDQVRINEPEKFDEFRWRKLGEFPEPLHTGFQETFQRFRPCFEEHLERP